MLERLAIAAGLLLLGYGVYYALRCYSLWRAAKQAPSDPLLADVERWWIDGGCEAALPDCQAEARRRLALASR